MNENTVVTQGYAVGSPGAHALLFATLVLLPARQIYNLSWSDMLRGGAIVDGARRAFSGMEEGRRLLQSGLAWNFSASFSGSLPAQPCPQGPSDCRKKQCDPEHYVDESGYCLACVSCFGGQDPVLTPALPGALQHVLQGHEGPQRRIWEAGRVYEVGNFGIWCLNSELAPWHFDLLDL